MAIWAPVADRPVVTKKSSGLGAGGVADDDQADQGVLADLVPEHVEHCDQPGGFPAAHVHGDLLPVIRHRGSGQLGRPAEPGAPGAGPAAAAGARRRRCIQRGVAAEPGGEVGAGQARAGQAGAGAVAGEMEPAIWQPAGDLGHHLGGQLVSRERGSLTSDSCSRTMAYAVDCERGGSAARP